MEEHSIYPNEIMYRRFNARSNKEEGMDGRKHFESYGTKA